MADIIITKEDSARHGRYVARIDGIDAEGEITFTHRGHGINSADQSVKLMYQLTRSIQAIGRVGSQSWGGEVKYIIRFD